MRIYNSKGAWVILLALIFLPFQAYAEKIGVGIGVGIGVPSSSSGDSHQSSNATSQNFSNIHNSSSVYKASNLNSANQNQTSNTNQNTQNRNNIPVYVGVNSRTNTVGRVQIGEHGSFLTLDQIKQFDGDKNGSVNTEEFQRVTSNNNFNWNVKGSPCNITGDTQDAEKMLDYMDTAKGYMADLNYTFDPPPTINIGDNGKGSYGSDNLWQISEVNRDTMYSKVIQKSLQGKYPSISYTDLEGYSRYYASHLPESNEAELSEGFTYNPDFADLNGDDITQAHKDREQGLITQDECDQIGQNATNNNLALSERLQHDGTTPETASNTLDNSYASSY